MARSGLSADEIAGALSAAAAAIGGKCWADAARALGGLPHPQPAIAIATCWLPVLVEQGGGYADAHENFVACVTSLITDTIERDGGIAAWRAGAAGTAIVLLSEIANVPLRDPIHQKWIAADMICYRLRNAAGAELASRPAVAQALLFAAEGAGRACAGGAFGIVAFDLHRTGPATVACRDACRLLQNLLDQPAETEINLPHGDSPLALLAITMIWLSYRPEDAFDAIKLHMQPYHLNMIPIFTALHQFAIDSRFVEWSGVITDLLASIRAADVLIGDDKRTRSLSLLLAFAVAFLIQASEQGEWEGSRWIRSWLLPEIAIAIADCDPGRLMLPPVIV